MNADAITGTLESLLSEPISSVRAAEQSALDRLLADVDGRVVLFGAGSLGAKAVGCLRRIGVAPLAMSDNDPHRWGTNMDGVPVVPPREAATRFGPDSLFIVTIWNPQHWYEQTHDQLRALGCLRVTPPAPLLWRFSETFLPFYAQDLPHLVYEQSTDVLRAAGIWSDDVSRDEYCRQIVARAGGPWAFGLPPSDQTSYFLTTMFALDAGESFLDCGAFDGDTLRVFLSVSRNRFSRYFAIEAESSAFVQLQSFVAGLDFSIRSRIEAINAFVGNSSEAGADGPSLFEARFAQQRLSFIKMDIEGSERAALLQARQVIERDRPLLAICVYHTQSDLWSLPLLMKEMLPAHRMFLRSYEGDGWQTVAYAVPSERCL